MKNNATQNNIPNGWELKTLSNLACIKKGEQLNRLAMDSSGKYPALNGGTSPSGYTDKWNTEANTITISEGGNSCGYVNFNKEKFWCGGHCYALLNLTKNIDNDFLYQALKSKQENLMKLRVGSGLPNIQKKSIEEFPLLLPKSKIEQQKIAEILVTVDEDIAKTQEVIGATEKLKRGLMQQLFTRGIGHTKFKETKLGKLCEFKYGFSLPGTKREKGGVPVYGSNGVVGSHNAKGVVGPVIIIGRKGTIGAVAWSDVDCWPIDTTYYVEKGNYDLKWLYYLLIYLRLNKMNTASGTPGLNRDEAYSRDVNVPDVKDQKEIADILSAVDEKISVNKKLKAKLTLLKKGLMQDLLSGKVRVKT